MSGNPQQYESRIRDFDDLDMEFDKLESERVQREKSVSDTLKQLIGQLYSDMVSTTREKDRKSTEKISTLFDSQVKSILSSDGGLSKMFDKAKEIIESEAQDGIVEESLESELVKRVGEELRKRLAEILNNRSEDSNQDDAETKATKVSVTQKQLDDYSRKILQNETLVKKISENIRKTIRGQNKKQSKNVINLLTGNRYKELSLKIRGGDIRKAETLTGKQTRLSAFGKIGMLKKSSFGKISNPKNILKVFKMKRPKLNRKGFLGLYNKYLYEQLMKRIDEFDNVRNFSEKRNKILLNAVLKLGGGAVVSGIQKVLGFGWNTMKSALKQVWNITKSVGKMGVNILSKVKNFVFNPIGQYAIGFFSGILFEAVMVPIVNKFKKWFDLILDPMKEWLGLDKDKQLSFEDYKKAFGDKLIEEMKETNRKYGDQSAIMKKFGDLEKFMYEVEDVLRSVEMEIMGGNWKRTVGGVAAGAAGTIGTVVGAVIGSLFGPLGTYVGAGIGGALGGFAASWANHFVEKLPKSDSEDKVRADLTKSLRNKFMRNSRVLTKGGESRYNAYLAKQKLRNVKRSEKEELDERIKTLEKLVSENPETSGDYKKELDELLVRRGDVQKDLDRAQAEMDSFGFGDETKDKQLEEIYKRLSEDNNYLSGDKNNIYLTEFFDRALKGDFQKVELKTDIQKLIARMQKRAMMDAMTKYSEQKIRFEDIVNYANMYLWEMQQREFAIKESGQPSYEYKRLTDIKEYDNIAKKQTSITDRFTLLDDAEGTWNRIADQLGFNNANNKDFLIYKDDIRRSFNGLWLKTFDMKDPQKRTMYILNQLGKELGNLVKNDQNEYRMDEEGGLPEKKRVLISDQIMTQIQRMRKEVIDQIGSKDQVKAAEKELEKTIQLTGQTDEKEVQRKKTEIEVYTKTKDNLVTKKETLQRDLDALKKEVDDLESKNRTKKLKKDGKGNDVPQILVVPQQNDDIMSANDESLREAVKRNSDTRRNATPFSSYTGFGQW